MLCRAAQCRPQVVGVGRLQQILRARTLLLLEKDVVLGVAVRADGALFAVGAADGFALQLHRQGNALRVVCKLKEQKKRKRISERFGAKNTHTALPSTTVGATWRFEGDLALLALGVVPDKRVPQEVRGDGPSVGVRFEAAQDEQLGVH